MQTGTEKTRPNGAAPQPTSEREAQKARSMTPRMHFYAVHNTGEQLRCASPPRAGKKPDRMVGR
jgi:hypothetical protein